MFSAVVRNPLWGWMDLRAHTQGLLTPRGLGVSHPGLCYEIPSGLERKPFSLSVASIPCSEARDDNYSVVSALSLDTRMVFEMLA